MLELSVNDGKEVDAYIPFGSAVSELSSKK
jgi:hypothetical protein